MFKFSANEKQELIAATFIFVLVELSLFILPFGVYSLISLDFLNLDLYIFMSLIFLGIMSIPLFLFHELAHKFVAQGNGLTSEFRFFPNMAILSFFSIFMPIKFIAPGVVLASGRYGSDTEARIAMAGPIVNILLGGFFLLFSTILSSNWSYLILFVSKFSFDLALFNLLPFFVLDGAKILKWHTGVFGVIFSLSIVLWLFHPLGIFGRFY
jgi:Zn-dependent protease